MWESGIASKKKRLPADGGREPGRYRPEPVGFTLGASVAVLALEALAVLLVRVDRDLDAAVLGRGAGDARERVGLAAAEGLEAVRLDAERDEVVADGGGAALAEALIVLRRAVGGGVPDDDGVVVVVGAEARGEVGEVGADARPEVRAVEVEQERVVEADGDAGGLTRLGVGDRLDGGVLELLVELLGLLLHLAADDGAGGAADGRADDGAAGRRARRAADDAADDGARARADDGALGGSARPAAGPRDADQEEEGEGERGEARTIAVQGSGMRWVGGGRGGEGPVEWRGGAFKFRSISRGRSERPSGAVSCTLRVASGRPAGARRARARRGPPRKPPP